MFNLDQIKQTKYTSNIISKNSSGNNVYIDKNTRIELNKVFLGTMEDVNNGSVRVGACDCPSNNHSDGGINHAHIVALSGGEFGIKCSGSKCNGALYVMNKELQPRIKLSELEFDDISSINSFAKEAKEEYKAKQKQAKLKAKEEYKESKALESAEAISEWLIENKAHVWFDYITEKYCLKFKKSFIQMSKSGFQQFFRSCCGVKIASSDIDIPALRSDFVPHLGEFFNKNGNEYINTFISSNMMEFDSCGVDVIPETTGLLLNSLFDDKEHLQEFLNWLAYIYQYRVRSGVAWVFAGKQGTGKGILADIIIKGIWQHNAVCNLTDNNLEGDFNEFLQDKLFVHFNEVSADTKKSRVAVKNRLKTWITDDTISINAKGIRAVEKNNCCNIIMNSNEHIPIDIEVGDRRFNVVRTNNVLKNTQWFDRETVNKISGEIEHFAKYLASFDVDIEKAKSVNKNNFKDDLIQAVKTIPELIADAFLNYDFGFFLDCGLEKWLSDNKSFSTPSLSECETEFNDVFVSNKVLTELVSAAFNKETNMMTATKIIFSKYDVGTPMKHKAVRGIMRKDLKTERIPF